ncbi:MAG: phosphatidate cytidylyltransferase [Rhizobiales bacterium]|nr:phosphatidate cytidylyltransferase [Hyphomicrobiales bacterium]
MAAWFNVAQPVLITVLAIYGLLIIASLITWWLNVRSGGKLAELTARVKSWWVMITVFALAVFISQGLSAIFLGLISYLALKEYFSMIPTRRVDRSVLFWAYLAVPIQYWWAYTDWYGMFVVFIPVWMFLFTPVAMVLLGETKGFLRAVGTMSWGQMMMVFALSHTAHLLYSGDKIETPAGGAGLLLFLVFCTQFNDVMQYVWGKLTGKHKIVPTVSPNKTWQGFIGGLLSTMLLSFLIAPYLTPMSGLVAALAGGMIALSGFLGDITLSALKRDLGAKDTGALIPGHGGILDRVDSLTIAAPVFVHFMRYFYY